MLTVGEVNDCRCASQLLKAKQADFVLGDKAYDTDSILEEVKQLAATAVIPPKSNRIDQREYDKHYYKERNLIERFFCKLKQFRGIATRYCKRAHYFLEAVKLASSIILMR